MNIDNIWQPENNIDNLIHSNNDILFWVYTIKSSSSDIIELEQLDNVFSCYPNQLDNIKWLWEVDWISIVDMKELLKWNLVFLYWEEIEIESPKILSSRVIELFESSLGNLHLSSIKRDWWSVNPWKMSTVAWKSLSSDLMHDLNREYSEESPFIWKNKDWDYCLAIHDLWEESIKFLKTSINNFIENKLSPETDEKYNELKTRFERNFKWIKYEELWDILKDILENNRFFSYSKEEVFPDEIKWDVKIITLWGKSETFYVYDDKLQNTIEYVKIYKINSFDDDFIPLSKRPWRLFLESRNQSPRIPRIWNSTDWYSLAISDFSLKFKEILKK